MNVLLIHSFWHPRGGDTTSLELQRAALEARGHTVVAFGTRHPDNLPEPGDAAWPGWVEPGRLAGAAARIWSRAAARALARVLTHAPARIDVAHVHHLHRHLTPSILPVLARAGIPTVWTLHDYELSCPTAHHYRAGAPCFACPDAGSLAPAVRHGCTRSTAGWRGSGVALVAEKALHRASGALGHVDAYVAPSRYLAARVAPVLPGARIVHLPNPVPLPAACAEPRRGVVFAGRMVEEKGVLDVVTMARAMPDTPFTLLGDGPLRRAAAALPNVRAPGAVPRVELQAVLERAEVVLVPSRWPENDPYAVTEAQAAGAVVVASDIGGIPEQIDPGVDGLLAPPANPDRWIEALRAALADPDAARQIGARARARIADERDPTRTAIALETLYDGLRAAGPSATSRRHP